MKDEIDDLKKRVALLEKRIDLLLSDFVLTDRDNVMEFKRIKRRLDPPRMDRPALKGD